MAFKDDIVTTIGADTRPFARALRTMKGQVAIVSKEMDSQLQTTLKGWLGFLAPAAIIAGLKKIVDLAKEARKEGKEFTKDGWISHETANMILTASDAFEKAYKIALEFGAYSLGYIAKAARYLGALSVTGDLAEADKQVNMLANAEKAQAAALAAKKAKQEAIIKLRKEEVSLQQKSIELTKRATAAQNALATAKKDRSKFTLEELASSNVRFSGQLGKDQFNAQRIIALEAQAAALKAQGYGPDSMKYFTEADRLRKGLVNVVEGDKFPFKGLEDAAIEQTQEMLAIRRLLEEQGIKVKNAK